MEIKKEEPLELWELLEILEKRRNAKKQFETVEQRRVYEYATKATKLNKEDALELLKKLMNRYKLPKKIAIQLVDILPLTLEELEPFIIQLEDEDLIPEEQEERDKLLSDLLTELRQYMDKARSLVEEEEKNSENM